MQKIKERLKKIKAFVKTLPLRTYLWYFIVASLTCTGITVSSYVSTSRGGDSAMVALFANDVTINLPITGQCYPGCEFEIPITVTNYEMDGLVNKNVCQVSQEYELSAALLVGNLPLEIRWKDDYKSDSFSANDPAIEYTHYIVVTWPIASGDETNYEYADEIEVLRVSAICEQTD